MICPSAAGIRSRWDAKDEDQQGRDVRRHGGELARDDLAQEVPRQERSREGERRDARPARTAEQLVDRQGEQEHGDEQQQPVQGDGALAERECLGVAEQQGPEEHPDRPPVAEDHRGQADVAAAARLPHLEARAGDHGEDRAAEAGERAGDQHGDELVAVDVHAQRLGRGRRLTAGPQAQAEAGAPQDPGGAEDQHQPDEDEGAEVLGEHLHDRREVADEEPVLLLEGVHRVGDEQEVDLRWRRQWW